MNVATVHTSALGIVVQPLATNARVVRITNDNGEWIEVAVADNGEFVITGEHK